MSRDVGTRGIETRDSAPPGHPPSAEHRAPSPDIPRPEVRPAIQAAIREAGAALRPLRIVACGTWLDAGRPVGDATPLPVGSLSGIVEYTPGDLTLTALAGTPIAAIDTATRAERQWLPLAPWGGDAGSLGATVATASAGPMSAAFGTPRDVVIGLEAVTGTGDVVRGGGRVVKNVAGFDLTRLMAGAWGTLGVITEVSVRLRALPEIDETFTAPAPSEHDALAAFLARLREAPIAPIALELVTPGLAAGLGLPAGAALLLRLAGNPELVRAQREELSRFTDVAAVPADVWSRLRASEPRSTAVVRLSSPLARLAATWDSATAAAGSVPGAYAHASVQRAVVRLVVPVPFTGSVEAVAVARRAMAAAAHEGVRIFERLPAPLWQELAPSAVASRLSRRVREAFDPQRVLNPGILGEESA